MTRIEFYIATTAAAQKRWPHLTQKQAATIAEKIAQGEDANLSPMWDWDAHASMRDEFVALALTNVEKTQPEMLRKAPTHGQHVALGIAALEKKLGRPATAPEKMTIARATADLTPDDLLEKVGADVELPDAVAQSSRPSAPANDVEALDAEVFRRFGKSVHQLSAGDRLRYHNAIKNEQRRDASAETNRTAALADAGGDFEKLPPAQRMSRFRAAEKAKTSNRT